MNSHHPVCFASTPPGPPRCIESGVRRLERAQARSLPPPRHFVTPLLGQEGSTPAHPPAGGEFFCLIL